jgi:hypothetical protein
VLSAVPVTPGLGDDRVGDGADAVDLDLHHVPGAEEPGRGALEPDAVRRPGGDHVAGVERHDLADIGEELADGEDHVRGVAILHQLPVDPGAQP